MGLRVKVQPTVNHRSVLIPCDWHGRQSRFEVCPTLNRCHVVRVQGLVMNEWVQSHALPSHRVKVHTEVLAVR